MRAFVFSILFFAMMAGSIGSAETREFQAPLVDDRPIAFSKGVAADWLNQWAADGFCYINGFENGAASFEGSGYTRGYSGEVNVITRAWGGYSFDRALRAKSDLFARITCR